MKTYKARLMETQTAWKSAYAALEQRSRWIAGILEGRFKFLCVLPGFYSDERHFVYEMPDSSVVMVDSGDIRTYASLREMLDFYTLHQSDLPHNLEIRRRLSLLVSAAQ